MPPRQALTQEQRTLRARIAAHTRWSQADPREGTAAARAAGPGSTSYWVAKVDPDLELAEAERFRRAESAKRAHFARLALKSAQARSKGKREVVDVGS